MDTNTDWSDSWRMRETTETKTNRDSKESEGDNKTARDPGGMGVGDYRNQQKLRETNRNRKRLIETVRDLERLLRPTETEETDVDQRRLKETPGEQGDQQRLSEREGHQHRLKEH